MDEGACLENRYGAIHRGFESLSLRLRGGAREADWARLLSECGGETPPRVRIPPSPPVIDTYASAVGPRGGDPIRIRLPATIKAISIWLLAFCFNKQAVAWYPHGAISHQALIG